MKSKLGVLLLCVAAAAAGFWFTALHPNGTVPSVRADSEYTDIDVDEMSQQAAVNMHAELRTEIADAVTEYSTVKIELYSFATYKNLTDACTAARANLDSTWLSPTALQVKDQVKQMIGVYDGLVNNYESLVNIVQFRTDLAWVYEFSGTNYTYSTANYIIDKEYYTELSWGVLEATVKWALHIMETALNKETVDSFSTILAESIDSLVYIKPLQDAMDSFSLMDAKLYSETICNSIVEMIKEIETTDALFTGTREAIEDYTDRMTQMLEDIVLAIDKAHLSELVAEYANISDRDYTYGTYVRFAELYEQALEILDSPIYEEGVPVYTQRQINEVVFAMMDAVENLEYSSQHYNVTKTMVSVIIAFSVLTLALLGGGMVSFNKKKKEEQREKIRNTVQGVN